ncbi:riboflavin synthase [Neoehrlichia mikurensis]|uniref:Riboflavin synthase n=1 Tax=Neoehrlichia mikurensis TaxID=89586 RepID=A0A9Q9BVQ5_9RICK|nr:riboflavin synthase [Neoehrlichia mikurensis]QXK91689.1 riboflavin synthase [Neoehrlichia mikurensis]QXK92900.1 riboflavin synthase [Neoehrlichia mikurensis]QXK93380.1 riboflavin synthase [Neoehrlichia mikurensis]UTO55673.1 riboflavin synthase [Neoehrlichia mikurensis]UTO56591.1 riboflavin synthase [Neoehrlichia mikurensis]
MFKGIITSIATVIQTNTSPNSETIIRISPIKNNFSQDLILGSSISCSGICLTITELGNNYFTVTVSQETLACTNISHWRKGYQINLEAALKLNDRIDGHFVQGHVDGTGKIISITSINESKVIEISTTMSLLQYIIKKGSIAVNGISLTVNDVNNTAFKVNIIPYTWYNTIFQYAKIHDIVNIEIDIIAKYIIQLQKNYKNTNL